MSEVFISYARSSERQAKAIGDALRAQGFAVWRDDEIPAHRAYADVIQERLAAAKAVLVIWSAEAAASEWVRSEAERGRTDRKLVQLSVDGAPLPMPFDQIQCAELAGWSGDSEHAGWRKVVASIGELVGATPSTAATAVKPAHRKLSICVLPFSNISGDPEQEYFSDGISEDIITDLSKVSALSVVARNTAFTFKGKNVEVPELAARLGVSHVLEGSVRKAGNRVRITAQLIDGKVGDHVWAERWDRNLDDIFALQDEISEAIVGALKLKLLPEEKKAIEARGTASAGAYDLILMARNINDTGSGGVELFERVVRLADRAIAIDPNYALAWVEKARAQATLVHLYGQTGDDGGIAAERALELDPNLAEAHAVRARRLHRAGQSGAAQAEIELALQLDPGSASVNSAAGSIHYENRRFVEAAPYWEAATRLNELDFETPAVLASVYVALDDMENARRVASIGLRRGEKALAQDRTNSRVMSLGVFALGVLGETERAREWIDRALLLDPDNHLIRYNFACTLSRFLGDADGALELLGHVLANDTGSHNLQLARTDPDLDPLREDPRFKNMMAEAEARQSKATR